MLYTILSLIYFVSVGYCSTYIIRELFEKKFYHTFYDWIITFLFIFTPIVNSLFMIYDLICIPFLEKYYQSRS